MYYLKHLPWSRFSRRVGFERTSVHERYDYALSFAGSARRIAELLKSALAEREIQVFYDMDEQHALLGNNVEEYLARVYQRDSSFVVCILSRDYPVRVWTNFEAAGFKERIGQNSVIPVLCSDATIMPTDALSTIGRLSIDMTIELDPQIEAISDVLSRHIMQHRADQATKTEDEAD